MKKGVTLSGKRAFPQFREIYEKGDGLVTLDYGDKWKSQRKFGLMTLRG